MENISTEEIIEKEEIIENEQINHEKLLEEWQKEHSHEELENYTVEELDEFVVQGFLHEREKEQIIFNINRKEELKNMTIVDAKFLDLQNREVIVIQRKNKDSEDIVQEAVKVMPGSDIYERILESYSLEQILTNTEESYQELVKFETDFEQFKQWRTQGKIITESPNVVIDNTEPAKIELSELKNLETEILFKLKLEIFEEEFVQNSENRDLRSGIRKSKDIFELFHNYHLLKEDSNNQSE